MTRNRLVETVVIVAVLAMGVFFARPLFAGCGGCGMSHGNTDNMNQGGMDHSGTMPMEGSHSLARPMPHPAQHGGVDALGVISQSVDIAIRNLETGKPASALAELKQTRSFIAKIKQAAARASVRPTASANTPVPAPAPREEAAFVNRRCPIMGSPIDPAKVPEGLTREYKGQKVAFCCGGCPGQWDKLSNQEKDAKLQEANP